MTAPEDQPGHVLPFHLSPGLLPIPEVRVWAMHFSKAAGALGRSVKTDSRVTLDLADARASCF